MSDLKNRILGKPDYASERKMWGDVEVEVRSMTARDRADFVAMVAQKEHDRAYQLREVQPVVVTRTVYDPASGELVFEAGDAEVLLTRNPQILDELFRTAVRLSGLDAKALEAAGNGSAPTQSGASATA